MYIKDTNLHELVRLRLVSNASRSMIEILKFNPDWSSWIYQYINIRILIWTFFHEKRYLCVFIIEENRWIIGRRQSTVRWQSTLKGVQRDKFLIWERIFQTNHYWSNTRMTSHRKRMFFFSFYYIFISPIIYYTLLILNCFLSNHGFKHVKYLYLKHMEIKLMCRFYFLLCTMYCSTIVRP